MKANQKQELDVVIVGAGFSGLYMLHLLREAGYSTRIFEVADDVGGTWYWNRYPGARCDIESVYYNYSFSEEIRKEWKWSARYAERPEILRYINFVADKLDLKRDIQFETRITAARYQEDTNNWKITTDDGESVTAKYFITAVGCLSVSNVPPFEGLENFKGEWYHTGRWPHEEVDFAGKRVGVIGTGSSGVQSIPEIAKRADHLTVFQRTPQYSVPAHNRPYDQETLDEVNKNYEEIREKLRYSPHGVPGKRRNRSVLEDSPAKRQQAFEKGWKNGGLFSISYIYNDLALDEKANKIVADFIRSKIRGIVKDPSVADKLMPTFHYGTKRQIIDTDYFETYNRDNVSLVDVKKAPIEKITETGLRTADADYELDMLVFATGFDAITGPFFKMDIRGKGGISLEEKWDGGAELKTYLGLATAGFPNMFMITGPESPSVLSNMMVSIEQHVEWIGECINYLTKNNISEIEAMADAENEWSNHCLEIAKNTLAFKADSWYTGANIEGKPRRFQIYLGGVGVYREKCEEVSANGYEGFSLKK